MFVGTLYPLALEALTGDKISVGAPFFNLTFGPLFVPLLLAVPFGPLLAWKRGDLLGVAQRLIGGGRALALVAHCRDVCDASAAGRCWRRSASGLPSIVMAGALTDLDRAHRPVPRAAGTCACARARPAALGLGHGVRAFRPRRDAARHRVRRDQWGAERIVAMKPGADCLDARLRSDLRRHAAAARARTISELVAQFTVRQGGEVIGVHGAVEAHLPVARRCRPPRRR